MNVDIKRTYSSHVDPETLISDILKSRDIDDMETFLNPPHPDTISLADFFTDKDAFEKSWKKSLELLKKIREDGSTIAVYTDYDADGVTGGAVMWETLHKLGFKVMPYIPDRSEGYGFSIDGINRVIDEHDPALIISVDHGIVGHEQITYAKQKGVPIIVTDHHHKQDGDPENAHAVFHTSQTSGSGVAYFFAKYVAEAFEGTPGHDHVMKLMHTDYIAIASIGAVADLVPLVGPTRSLVKEGLKQLASTRRPGLKNMIEDAQISGPLSTYHIGYIIAPRINAFGRLEHAMDALRLLCTPSRQRASELSAKANDVNSTRQQRVKEAVEQAHQMVDHGKKIIVLGSDDWEEGIIGLIAGKIMQAYYKPTIVFTRSDGEAKASVRSVDGIHITDFLSDLKDHLIDMGGHAAAAGFSISNDNIDAFVKAAYDKAEEEFTEELLTRKRTVDALIPLSSASLELAEQLQKLEPFGIGNEKPYFVTQGKISGIQRLGKNQDHTKILLSDGNAEFEALKFYDKEPGQLQKGHPVSLMLEVQVNEWNGRKSVQGIIKGVV